MNTSSTSESAPRIIPRAEHSISRSNISKEALKVLYGLKKAGHAAYLVGGGVRDLLLGREPKDFDIATDASPEEIRAAFRNCRLIGRRFRLAHIHFGREIIEVATFRAQLDGEAEGDVHMENGRIIRDNVYGTIEEDVWRRDFTVNALYYNIRDFSVIDYVGGYEDLQQGLLRLIGDPEQRYREDPVRMLRAVRFACKLGMRIEPETEAPMRELAPLLGDISPARLFEEVLKLFHAGYALQTYEQLRHYDLFGQLFPMTEQALAKEENGFPNILLAESLRSTDKRIAEGKPVNPAFLFAALLWQPMQEYLPRLRDSGMPEVQAIQVATDKAFTRMRESASIPRRFALMVKEIYVLQARLMNRAGRRALRLLELPRFRAAYDFLVLRAIADESLRETAEWWTRIQEVEGEERDAMLLPAAKKKKARRRRSKPRKKPEGD
ncbi:polynucleotide adenylyltransferase PcnB [Sulfuriflexus sp.]|uniref:polynucleotide adenylyltransferase PcnB n=1 Tax=Sulfuriflexus sp. TaxID=2015443 RepID=UPI0028CF45F1|nr:polynucleotide adenylyltransferase PcnB [Sulfuriflexus sp.]MDT8404031.1 polynucleotide adenylyltransferase PcnB [Sulfuriflexus sp.]